MKEFVSIIIPCRKIDNYTEKCINHCLKLNYKNYEILLLPDKKPAREEIQGIKSKKLRIIPTGKVLPAGKRNFGMKKARGNFYAFIDSDAYPDKNWLKNAVRHMQDNDVGMVGGPNLTPKEDGFKERISGMLLATWFCTGRTSIRYKIAKQQETIELPSCNFVVKKEFATKFEPDLLTAEDTKFCFNILKKNKKIMYEPDVIVYHHRRGSFRQYIRQIWIYGRDIAFLLKRKGHFSIDKFYYSLLSLFVLGVIGGAIISIFNPLLKTIYLSVIALYLILTIISSIRRDIKTMPLIFVGIIATHFAYGFGFIYGLLTKSKKKPNLR